ncbi:MAG: diaminopimelate decarboxylase [Bacillota bacterium]
MLLQGTTEINEQGVLEIGNVEVTELRGRYGSPLLVYDYQEILNNISKFKEAVSSYPGRTEIIYASKAFLCQAIADIIARNDLYMDVVSGGEFARALAGDLPADRIYLHGNNKSEAELNQAISAGVNTIIVDNFYEAELLEQLAASQNKKIDCLVRLIPGISAHTHEFIRTGQADSKFGVSIKTGQARKMINWIEDSQYLNFKGIHAHIGSQIYDDSAFKELIWVLIKFMIELRREDDIFVDKLNLGGGFGVPEKSEDPEIDVVSLVKEIVRELVESCEREDYPLPALLLEPGRSIVGTAGTSLYTVGSIKEIGDLKTYLAVDGGMADNIRPALYGAEYEGFLANRCNDEEDTEVTIVGKCCESGDILIKDEMLAEPRPGDILAIPSTGAYTYSLASNYNGLLRPAVLLVYQGETQVIIERENIEDLYKNDCNLKLEKG